MLGCGKREAARTETTIQAAIRPAATPPALRLIRSEDGPTSLVLTLRWPAGSPDPESLPALVFCLPENQSIKGRFLDARIGGKPVPRGPASQPNPAGTFLNQPLQIESAGYLRRWPLYRLNLPVSIFELLRGQDAAARNQDLDLVLQIGWTGPTPASYELPGSEAERYWRRIAEAVVINRSGLDRYASAAPPNATGLTYAATDPRPLVPDGSAWARLRISRDGVYRIGRDELIRSGFPSAEANPDAIRIFSRGQAVPVIRVAAGDPSGLPPGLYFWATGATGPYTRERIYWLTLAPGAADPRIKTIAGQNEAAPEQAVVRRAYRRDRDEQLVTLHGRFLAIEAIRWVEAELGRSKDVEFPIELPDCEPAGLPMRANIEFLIDREMTTLQPRVEVRAGNHLLGTITVSNFDEPRGTVEIPPAALEDGRTTLTLRMMLQQPPNPSEDEQESGLWLDKIDIDYNGRAKLAGGRLALGDDIATSRTMWTSIEGSPTLALRIDDRGAALGMIGIRHRGRRAGIPRAPGDKRIEVFSTAAIEPIPAAEMAELDNLADPKEGADLLIVTHKEFAPEARRLAKYHQDKGWRVRVADIQNVYDSFSDGEFTPLAIRRLLACALRSWRGGAPAAVLLVGDCDSDYLDVVKQGVRNWVPTYTFSHSGDNWASDYWFTTVAGEDDLGDYVIGRLPVADAKDLKQIVDKLIAYETDPEPGPWRGRLGWVSDDGEFPEVIDGLRRNNTPPAMSGRRVFLSEMPLEDNWYLPKSMVERKHMKVSRQSTDAILDAFRRGVVYMTYYGHGSPNIWADERIWFGGDSHNSDNLQLANLGRPAFVACMTCNSGAIDFPERPWNVCISEDMLRVPGGGAIGCFVPSGPGITYIHKQMSETLGGVLFGDKFRGMGEVTALAKLRYSLAAQPRELVFMYLLLGDPLVNLQMITDWARLDLEPGAIAPGSRARIDVDNIPIKSCKWSAQLVRTDESVIWQADGETNTGRIPLAIDCPTTVTGCEALLRVTAWDGKQGWAAAGPLAVERPYLTMGELDADSTSATVTIRNPGKLEAAGELSLVAYDDRSTRSLDTRKVELAAGAQKTEQFKFNVSGPARIEARLRLTVAPDDPGLPREDRRERQLAGSDAYRGWLRHSLRIERDNPGNEARVIAWAQTDTTPTCALVMRNGVALTTTTLAPVEGAPRVKQALFNVNRALLDRLAGGSVRLNAGPAPATLPLADARILEPRLRIVPGSVSWRPRPPTQGQTVFVSCEIENAGTATSAPCGVELRKDGPGGESLPDAMGTARRDVPRLAPGRRAAVEMRWDPFDNVGANKIQIRLDPGTGIPSNPAEQVVAFEITALTKASFKVNRTWAEAGRNDILANRINLFAEVANNGQTDARRVMVSFYKGTTQTLQTEIGQVELDRIPGVGKTRAHYVWNFQPGADYTEGQPLPQPTVRVWLRGSSQRFSSTSGDVVD